MKSYEEQIDNYFNDLAKYKSHDFLYKISGADYDEVMAYFDSSKSSKHNAFKDIIRKTITKKLSLNRLDTIFITTHEIYIKLFIRVDEKDGERRACGIDEALLKEYKKKYFSDEVCKKHTLEVLESVVEDILSFRKLNPHQFKKVFISVFINMMELIVIERTHINQIKEVKGFSLYLLREMFDEFLLYIAEDILFHFSNNDKKAIEFISSFKLSETIDANGLKYKANPIIDDNQRAWNTTTIRSTMMQYKHAKQDIYNKKNALLIIKKKLKDYELELKELEKQKKKQIELILKIDEKIKVSHKNLDVVKKATTDTIKFLDNGVEKMYQKNLLVSKLFKQEDVLLDEKKSLEHGMRDINIKSSNKQKDIDIWIKKYNESEKVLQKIDEKGHPIDKQYNKLKESLAKTLAKR